MRTSQRSIHFVVAATLAAATLSFAGPPALAATGTRTATQDAPNARHARVLKATHGESRPLRTLPAAQGHGSGHAALTRNRPTGGTGAPTREAQSAAPTGQAFTAPQQNFEGMGHSITGFKGGGTPPDPNSDVSATQIVEVVNTSVAVFSKTGELLHPPVATGSLFASLSNACGTRNDGDGVVRYDALAHRWLIAQFAIPTDDGQPGPDYECVAVSATDDATGAYHVYAFADAFGGFPDYGKFGVWPDAYYATFNDFDGDESGYLGDVSCAYDRTSMLAGDPATEQCINLGSGVFGLLPADLEGPTPPPAGAPNYQLALASTGDASSLLAWEFHVDWAAPANTTLTPQPAIVVPRYAAACEFYSRNRCIPEPAGGETLESLGDRLMFPLTYRSFGADGMLTVSHAVSAGSTTGERWYQLQVDPANAITLDQSGTFAPSDSQYRFMGSITSDHANDLALGYSTSSGSTYPDIRYTGRLAADPAGTMTQSERTIFSGTGYETTYGRWGDYSSMDIDPADDCTFWYTNEYYTPSTTYTQWNTRIASFTNPTCGSGEFGMSLSSSSGHTGRGQASTTVRTSLASGSPGSIGLSVSGVPAGATATVDKPTVSAGGSATLTFDAGTAPAGTYRLVVTGHSPTARHSVEYDVTVTNDFDLSLSPTSATATAAGPLPAATVSTSLVSGTAGTLDLSVTGVPQGATATLGAPSVTTGGGTTLTVDPGTALAGVYPITLTATDSRPDGAVRHATYRLTIVPDYSLALDPTSGTASGPAAVTTTVNTTAGFGGAAPLALSASGLPSGAHARFSPSTVSAGASSTLAIDPGSAANGTYEVTVTAHNSTGPGTDRTARFDLTVDRDTTAPQVTLHAPPAVTLAGSVPLSWNGSDAGSGVASYQLRQHSATPTGGFGAWTIPSAWRHLTATSVTAAGLTRGREYCYSVRATDASGNTSSWTPPRCVIRALDDRALVRSAHWKHPSNAHWWNHTATTSKTRHASLTLAHAQVSRLGVLVSRCPTCGKLGVYVGTHQIGVVNLKGPRANQRIVMLPRFALRSGTVKLIVLTSRKSVIVDGLFAARS
ncbi:fibronectin type III domain-containing protein [Nocardioides terrisoli]|uniref:hypothetical protein n=1 Tax=Nocardioides terrisoli TaxID=3388267 RepID=UPI00287B8776|nr:hypothetical protein [Nocardioides marmorisolisilvae]